MSARDREGFTVVALICWLLGVACPRTFEYRFTSADGREGKLNKVGRTVYRKITFLA